MLTTVTYLAIAIGAIHVTGVACAVHALLWTRSSQGAIAWTLSLIMLPYFAVPLYLIFGRRHFKGYQRIKSLHLRLDSDNAREIRKQFLRLAEPYGKDTEKDEIADWQTIFARPFLGTNSVKLLVDGKATFDAILEGIDSAQDYILFQFFIFRNDELGQLIASRLCEKARNGVRVFFLYDEIGSKGLPQSFINDMRRSGVRISPFNTTQGIFNKFQLNFRNHRKVVVIDGRIGFVGGLNVGDEYLGKSKRFGKWHDLHIRIEGPESAALQLAFLEDWIWAVRETPNLTWSYDSGPGHSRVLTVASGPAEEVESCTMMFLEAINSSKERIWISSPYFVPDGSILMALQLAARRGVDVRILLPKRPDHFWVWLASFAYIPQLLKVGARVYRYTEGFLHAKAFVMDKDLAMVGTPNLDNRSFRLNFEIASVVLDRTFCSELSTVFVNDFSSSEEETVESMAKWSFSLRLSSRLARLLSPIL